MPRAPTPRVARRRSRYSNLTPVAEAAEAAADAEATAPLQQAAQALERACVEPKVPCNLVLRSALDVTNGSPLDTD